MLIGVLISVSGCKNFGQIKFDKAKWNEDYQDGFPPKARNKMVNDLVENHKLKGLKYWEVIELLGEPIAKDSSTFSYEVVIKYDGLFAIDPTYVKSLVFYFSKDSTITDVKIEESGN